MTMELVASVLEATALAIDVVAYVILLFAAIKFVGHFVGFEIRRLEGLECVDEIRNLRLGLGSYILLALEFMIISDVIRSGLTREMDDFLLLGVIIVIRTAMGVFLSHDLAAVKAQK